MHLHEDFGNLWSIGKQRKPARLHRGLGSLVAAVAVVFSLALSAPPAAAVDLYEFDPAHSSIGFGVRHMVITTVRGKFNKFEGRILYDPENITQSSVEVSIEAASIDTGIQKRDNHLRSADFFDVEKHRQITFKSQRIEKTADGFVAHGPLTMHGVTKEVAIPFTVAGPVKDAWGGLRIGAEANLTIDRRDWGLNWNQALEAGGVLVDNNVRIELNVQAVKRS
jgi:polyisoprenoid-binding protein YceI